MNVEVLRADNSLAKDYLRKRENIEVLEEGLARVGQQFLDLETRKDKLDFGPEVRYQDVAKRLPKITKATREFLGIDKTAPFHISMIDRKWAFKYGATVAIGISALALGVDAIDEGITRRELLGSPTIGLMFGIGILGENERKYISSHYDRGRREAIIEKQTMAYVVPSVIHEYAHHIQARRTTLIDRRESSIVAEGHASGTDRHVSEVFSLQEDNPAYLYDPIKRTAIGLKDTYLWVCRSNHLSPSQVLVLVA